MYTGSRLSDSVTIAGITIGRGILILVFTMRACVAQVTFSSLDAVLTYAGQHSATIRTGELQRSSAAVNRRFAIAGIPGLQGNTGLNVTDNRKLPVNFLPAEIFGETPGTFKEVTLGRRYVNDLSGSLQLTLLNLPAWDDANIAGTNIRLTDSNNRLNKRALFENIAAVYYNIMTLQEQLHIDTDHLRVADTLLQVIKERYAQGIVRQQDVNDAAANFLNIKEALVRAGFQLTMQYNNLKVLCDIPLSDTVKIMQLPSGVEQMQVAGGDDLYYNNVLLKEKMARTTWKQQQHTLLPVLTVGFSDSRMQYSNSFALFDSDVKWVPVRYYSVNLTWTLPTAASLRQLYTARFDHQVARLNTAHARLKTDADNRQRVLDYDQALSKHNTAAQVYALKEDNYRKSFNQFVEGVLAVDKVITVFNDMLNSRYDYSSALAEVLLAKAKIDINNRIK